jgi:hypothetical protein
MLVVMRRGRIICGTVLVVLITGLVCLITFSKRPVLAWKVVSVGQYGPWAIKNTMEPCWSVDIEVTNQTSSRLEFDWNKSDAVFWAAGKWESLGLASFVPDLDGYESCTFSLRFPERGQACRVRLCYGPRRLWLKTSDFLMSHGVNMPEELFDRGLALNYKIPAHLRRVEIEAMAPVANSRVGDTMLPHMH